MPSVFVEVLLASDSTIRTNKFKKKKNFSDDAKQVRFRPRVFEMCLLQ